MASTITLNGRTYAVDYGARAYQRASIPLLRRQSDSSERPGSASVNPEGAWRRSIETWHHGSGQSHQDRDDSDPARYESSTNIDPWDRWGLRLLHRTLRTYIPTTSLTHTLVVGTRLYAVDGATVVYTDTPDNGLSWATVTGLPGGVTDIKLATDGLNVYIPQGAAGLYKTNVSTGAAASYSASACTEAYYVKGRLIITNGTDIANVVDAATTEVLATLPNGRWVDVTESTAYIYAATSSAQTTGYGEGSVYRIGILADGTGLDVPIPSATLPTGEDAFSIFGYMGYVLVGTSRGVRFAQENGDGSLTVGSVRTGRNSLTQGVRGFTAQGSYVWFTQSTDGGSDGAGLGRLDLTEFIAPLTPAGADDLTFPPEPEAVLGSTVDITYCGTYENRRFFLAGGNDSDYSGLYMEMDEQSTIGVWESGRIGFGILEHKIPLFLDLFTDPLLAGESVSVWVAVEDGNYVSVGTFNDDDETAFPVDLSGIGALIAGRSFRIRLQLNAISGQPTGPTIRTVLLRTYPVAARGEIIKLPVLLGEEQDRDGAVVNLDVSAELAALRALTSTRQLVDLVEGDTTTKVYLEDFDFRATGRDEDGTDLRGTILLTLKSFG